MSAHSGRAGIPPSPRLTVEAPRYFVTYRRPHSDETTTRVFGRFPDPVLAERIARTQLGEAGCEVLAVRAETPLEAMHHRISRSITRTLRIALGTGLTLLAWHALFLRTGPRITDMPLGRLTIGMLLIFGLHAALMLAALVFCWDIAFGEGPYNGR